MTRTNPRRATHNFENHHRDDSNLGAKALYCVGIVSIIKAIETMTAKLVPSQGIDLMLLAMVIAFRFNLGLRGEPISFRRLGRTTLAIC